MRQSQRELRQLGKRVTELEEQLRGAVVLFEDAVNRLSAKLIQIETSMMCEHCEGNEDEEGREKKREEIPSYIR